MTHPSTFRLADSKLGNHCFGSWDSWEGDFALGTLLTEHPKHALTYFKVCPAVCPADSDSLQKLVKTITSLNLLNKLPAPGASQAKKLVR